MTLFNQTSIAMDSITGNSPYAISAGYSSGAHTSLLFGELRHNRGLRTDIIMIGLAVAPNAPNLDIMLYDINLTPLTENDFVTRVKTFADTGNHVLVIDDASHFTSLDGYNNITYVPVSLTGDGHSYISDIDSYAQQAYQWLNNNYTWP